MVIFEYIIKYLDYPNCKQSTLYVDETDSRRKGFASYIIIKCFQYTYTLGKYTSQTVDNSAARRGAAQRSVT